MNMLATYELSFPQSVLWPRLFCRGVFLGKKETCGINYVVTSGKNIMKW